MKRARKPVPEIDNRQCHPVRRTRSCTKKKRSRDRMDWKNVGVRRGHTVVIVEASRWCPVVERTRTRPSVVEGKRLWSWLAGLDCARSCSGTFGDRPAAGWGVFRRFPHPHGRVTVYFSPASRSFYQTESPMVCDIGKTQGMVSALVSWGILLEKINRSPVPRVSSESCARSAISYPFHTG